MLFITKNHYCCCCYYIIVIIITTVQRILVIKPSCQFSLDLLLTVMLRLCISKGPSIAPFCSKNQTLKEGFALKILRTERYKIYICETCGDMEENGVYGKKPLTT
jgi:hypothetical protein